MQFCKQWSRHFKQLQEPLSKDEARRAHTQHELYTAVLGPVDSPWCFVEITAFHSVNVEFLDVLLRSYMYYSFQAVEEKPEQLYLSMACIREFEGAYDDPIRGPVCLFKPDGQLLVEHYEYNRDTRVERIVAREESQIDASQLWEPYPEFGRYERLIRIRDIPQLKL